MTDLKFTSPSGETTLKLEGTGRLGTVTPKTQLHIHEVTDKRESDRMAKQLVDNAVKEVKKMTNNKQTPPDTIEIGGVKYKRVEDTQPFYDKLWGLLKTKLGDSVECDDMADKVRDLIREHIPEPVKNNFMSEYLLGYNECIREIKNRLFNGIQ